MGVQVVLGRLPRTATIKAEGPTRLAIRAHREPGLDLVEAAGTLKGHAAPELVGPGLVAHELVGTNGDGRLTLDELRGRARAVGVDGLRRGARVGGENCCVAVEVGAAGAGGPAATSEHDCIEGFAGQVIAADGDAAIAAFACGLGLGREHYGERAVHAVYHAE